ncbi:hypothetical protein [Agromyces sp. LHK192]|uniref:hypothetical protein n=1 Tax=Agromyces sp. LHK192 TaxID=2498704 RepID=UPI000FD99360|nr:hypothetical protein [Agromyces sp. LHK192]
MGSAFEAAEGGGYVDDAATALSQGSHVYVSPEVTDASALQAQLAAQVGADSIGVAVFSDNAALEASAGDIVPRLAEQTGYDTIVVAVGDDLAAGSSVLERGQAMEIANTAQTNPGGVDAALAQTVTEVQAATDDAGAGGGGGDTGVILVVAISAAAVLAAVGGTIAVVRARRRKGAGRAGLPDPIRRHVANLRSLAGAYGQVGATGNAAAAQTGTEIAAIAEHVEELFARLDRQSGSAQRGLAAGELDGTLGRLTAALDRDYLLDILTHPHLWDDPDERVAEVRDAVSAVSEDLVRNIRQVNARRGVHFQVSLDGLVGRRSELQEWERAFKTASDDANPPA